MTSSQTCLYSRLPTLVSSFFTSRIIWQQLVPFDVQPSCCLRLGAVLAQTVMPSLKSNFCNSHPVVSSSLFICSLMIRFALSIIFEAFLVPGLREWVPVCSYHRRNFKTLTFMALCPSSVKWQAISAWLFPNAGNIESSTSGSLRTPSKPIPEDRWRKTLHAAVATTPERKLSHFQTINLNRTFLQSTL